MSGIGATDLALYLHQIRFPATKQQLIDHAKSRGAPDSAMLYFNHLPPNTYTKMNEVMVEFGKLKPRSR